MRRSSLRGLCGVLALCFVSGCTTGGTDTTTAWTVSSIPLAPDEDYVMRLIAACREAPTTECRDKTVDACKGHIDGAYYEAKEAFLSGGGGGDAEAWWTTVPVLNLVFATASSRETQTSKVADMSAATALLNGVQSIFRRPDDQDRLLDDKEVLVAQMEAGRKQVAQSIDLKSIRPIADYTLEQALSDLGRYRMAGTPTEARTRLASLLGI